MGEQSVNPAAGGPAEHMHFIAGPRAAHEGKTHHGISEVMKFDDQEAGFHRANQRRLSK
jgi:hypothetical protein